MLHEAGHFATAKAFGVKALPLGGFVKITGMTSIDDVDPADEPRSFRAKPGWQRAIVLAAGSFMHFVIAFVLLWILAVGVGVADQSGTTVRVLACVPAQAQAACAHGDPRSPAAKAGLQSGDKVIAVAGTRVHNWNQIGRAIKAHPAGAPV